MLRIITLVFVLISLSARGGLAQSADDVVWVQVEAQPSIDEAVDRISGYANELEDVNGFALSSGWYAIALGPYAREDAEQVLRLYRSQGLIPNDSYIAFSTSYGQQFWPEGTDILGSGNIASIDASGLSGQTETLSNTLGDSDTQSNDVALERDPETPAQARRNENLMTRTKRQRIQTALQWAGFYNAAIDGAFGRGTRTSMSRWQSSNGYEPTGVLTTRQRAVLLDRYNAILEGLDMRLVRDSEAGIEMTMPLSRVQFSRYEAPFAQYDAKGDQTTRVLLISQEGTRDTLRSLYDVMQTLEIVPLEGTRTISRDSFTLIGRNDRFTSETRATLSNGEIKGFTLIWPAGDEERRKRILAEMDASFTRLPGTLDPALDNSGAQNTDLVAGLQVRKPRLSRSGFFVDAAGSVVTTADAVESCTRITLDDTYEATLREMNTAQGVAVLRPNERLAPPAVARFSPALPGLQSEVAVAGYSFEGQLQAPSMTFGTLSDVKGLQGEPDLNRLALKALPGDEGGPVFDSRGQVFGMLLPRPSGSRQLPDEVRFALTVEAITGVLSAAGLAPSKGTETASLAPEDIAERGVGMTVLVSCWE